MWEMSKINKPGINRRDFIGWLIKSTIVLGSYRPMLGTLLALESPSSIRRFHICLQPQAMREYPELPSLIKAAGVTDIWLGGFLYGHWYLEPDELKKEALALRNQGFQVHVINVPLGHPGASIGLAEGNDLNTPPVHWKNACLIDGKKYSGTSIHPPAVEENVHALSEITNRGFRQVFLDDDFRLARSPGQIGGCFCDNCRKEFLDLYGYGKSDWTVLLNDVTNRNPSLILRNWIDYCCNKLYDMFIRLQMVRPEPSLGIMVMYLGAEKAGIPLDRFRQVPFRVGELMFDDKSFGHAKGKTDELFSALFHRRFTQPDLAYSETTAYPANKLSAINMAAKLTVSLIADVRNTMFMSGLFPFPVTHWPILGPAMKKSAAFHEIIAGHKPRGPFKHFWGWDSRLVGKDKPFSLFLALGIPFEIVEELPADGWVFLSDEDAGAVSQGRLRPVADNLIIHPEAGTAAQPFIKVGENLDDLYKFKSSIVPGLKETPFVEEDTPVVFSWYPTAHAVLIWNLTDKIQEYTIKCEERILKRISVAPLDVELITNLHI